MQMFSRDATRPGERPLADAHTHLDFDEFDEDRSAVVARARALGVATWVICGSDHERWDNTIAVADETGGIPMLGVHPWCAAELDAPSLAPWLSDLSRRPLIGLGEIGLDILYAKTPAAHENQRRAFRAQLAIARERDLPVAIHCVRAYPELLALLERDKLPKRGGMLHAWSGPPDQIPRALALGLYVSFGPDALKDRAKKVLASIPLVPDGRLLVETDCPNGRPPGTLRGEPAHLPAVIAAVAGLRGQSAAHVGEITWDNLAALLAP